MSYLRISAQSLCVTHFGVLACVAHASQRGATMTSPIPICFSAV